ncbi:RrF2 family transcriptional regulator [Cohnella herbarum]|uniref:Rrf2 family transcriptional regulator n=1 Tax=Cohnella herbarum TaxID=2728023 RepID=A0A7Z2VH10_9BACL|nr:Rrf2 family transcriptional regulator [Cohnella herbarum]QJD83051.1 Rrf2 family transcriptional regulator [Cohnella herbarum]
MQFSKSTGYALHALIHLARAQRGHNVGIKELSGLLGVSESYLSKIMSKLRQDGILRAVTGASGGYELARDADRITFQEVVQVVEGRQQLFECVNLNGHPGNKECLVKKVMNGAERQMYEYLEHHTIQSVLDSASIDNDSELSKK